jgi:hypothetical protein
MTVAVHPHAVLRCEERGTNEDEIVQTVLKGDTFPAKHGRTGFRRNFPGRWLWRNRAFDTKQLEVYAVHEDGRWLAITVIVKFFGTSNP